MKWGSVVSSIPKQPVQSRVCIIHDVLGMHNYLLFGNLRLLAHIIILPKNIHLTKLRPPGIDSLTLKTYTKKLPNG